MKIKIVKLVVLGFFIFLLSGCFDYQELNEMDFVKGIGIDYVDNKYEVSLEIVKAISSDGSNEIKSEMIMGDGKSIDEAFTNTKNKCDKEIFLEHVNLLVLSKSLAMRGIKKELDYLIRDIGISTNYMTIVYDKPRELLSMELDNDSISDVVVNTIKENIGSIERFTVDKITTLILNEQEDIVLPYVQIDDKSVLFNELMIFKNDIGVKTMDKKLGVFLITKSNNVTFRDDDMTFVVYSKDISYEVDKNKIIVKVKALGEVKEITEGTNLKDGSKYNFYNERMTETIFTEVNEFIEETRKENVDILGLRDKYYKKYGKIVDDIDYEVVVEAKLNKNGAIYEGI